MKHSGVEWIGEIPEHWEVRRLKFAAEMRTSTVDKHTKLLELPVLLCNYVDVYKNEEITSELEFMNATATTSEIERFRLKANDILITKDSEDFRDIGVPAIVKFEKENLICGYHLAIIRSPEQNGAFIHRLFLSEPIRLQLSIRANGVTRYGLSHDAVNSLWLPLPPLPEQTAIANFLDTKLALIDKAIAQKQRMIELLQERKQILTQQAVTRGLDPNVKLKDSGVEWIGMVPEGWEVRRAKFLFDEINERSLTGDEELLSVSHMTGVTPRSEKNVSMFQAEDYTGAKLCRPNDLVFNIMWAWMGALGLSGHHGIVSSSYAVLRAKPTSHLNLRFVEELLKSEKYITYYNQVSTGLHSSRLRFYAHMFFNTYLLYPSVHEQDSIETFIIKVKSETEMSNALHLRQIEALKAYKTTLINSAVTGKLRVI
jgi:type I restriction enzyme, S subunit